MTTDRPGREIPKEYGEIVAELIDNQRWRYDAHRSGHPLLYPADMTKRPFPVPTTPGARGSLKTFIGHVRRSGGTWPPKRKRRW